MRPQASLRRSETSRRKIQSRFSVFTTSSQNKNPAPSVNPGTKQLWQTRCDTSANDEGSEANIWLHPQWSTSKTNIWWITTNNDEVSETNVWLYQGNNDKDSDTDIRLHQVIHLRNTHLMDLMDHKQMMPQKRPSDIIHPAGPDITWQQPQWSSEQPDFTNNCHPTNTYLTNKHTSESLTPFKRQHCQLMSP